MDGSDDSPEVVDEDDDPLIWFTNTESCSISSTRPTGMDDEKRRQMRDEVLMRQQSMNEWQAMLEKSEVMRMIGPWEEMLYSSRDGRQEANAIFYFNVDDNVYTFEKPEDVVKNDIEKRGWDLIEGNRPEDWRRMRQQADILRRAGDWEEQRDRETEAVFYFNTNTGESTWMRPDVIHEQEQQERGWYMVNRMRRENWEILQKQSKVLRIVGESKVQELRDRTTLTVIYYDEHADDFFWNKTDEVLSHDRDALASSLPNGTDREWGLIRMRSERLRRVNAWHEFRDGETNVLFYYNDSTGHYQLRRSRSQCKRMR